MNGPPLAAVVTTIQAPTQALTVLADALRPLGAPLLVIGDAKGPEHFELDGASFIGLAAQARLPLALARLLPENHYARKNLGYLLAIQGGAGCIYETDDDNAPLANWAPRQIACEAEVIDQAGWTNVYAAFGRAQVWPRGLPLECVRGPAPVRGPARRVEAPVQQGLAEGSPDVDAVWRLLHDTDVRFDALPGAWLAPGSWCPFNSQTTWWWPLAWPLLYLPSFCSFRMTDIWRSFVAQRCLWALGLGVVFHAPEVVQARNPHRLLEDFRDEVPGYLNNARMAACLEALVLEPDPAATGENMRRCWAAISAAGWVPARELDLVDAWLGDLARLGGS